MGCFVRGGRSSMGCFVRGSKNGMGCFVRGDKNCMGCFVRGGKLLRDVLSGVAKNGMGCFVPGCFVLHSYTSRIFEHGKRRRVGICRVFNMLFIETAKRPLLKTFSLEKCAKYKTCAKMCKI